MDYVDAVSLLRRVPFLSNCEGTSLKMLAFSCSYLTLHEGENLCVEGDVSDSVYVIDQGEVAVSVCPAGVEVSIGRLGALELVGEMGVIRNQPRSATVRAVGLVRVLRIDADVFLSVVSGNPQAAIAVMRVLCDRLARTTADLQQLRLQHPTAASPR
jgi:CRP-like cAMP-binding protein